MKIEFNKYQGTGNDFVIVDNRTGEYDNISVDQIKRVCNRKFGVGADGFIRINTINQADFEIDYFNADDKEFLW